MSAANINNATATAAAASIGITVSSILSYLTGKSLYSSELQSLGMALQANIIVQSRYTTNSSSSSSSSSSYWFYRFLQSVLIGYSGGIFGTIFLGKPCPFLLNDIHMTSCLFAFGLVQIVIPNLLRLLRHSTTSSSSRSTSNNMIYSAFIVPIQIIITLYAQLFRTMGLLKFITVCYNELLLPPNQSIATKYYSIPIFGPILYGTLLGNMGGFVLNGIDGYTQRSGIPYPFQNGIFCGTLYHFYVHDTTGIIGTTLRLYLQPLVSSFMLLFLEIDDDKVNNHELVATVMVSVFMQIVAILQLPICFGPTFSPFVAIYNIMIQFLLPFQSHTPNSDSNDDDIIHQTTTTTNMKQKNNTKKESTTANKASVKAAKDKKL